MNTGKPVQNKDTTVESFFPRLRPVRDLVLLDFVQQLQSYCYATPQQQTAAQTQQLQLLLRHANRSPFWQKRLNDLGLAQNAPIDLATFRKLPILTRSTLQENVDSIKTYPAGQALGSISSETTTGSTGHPITVVHYKNLHQLMYLATIGLQSIWYKAHSARLSAVFRHACKDTEERPSGWPMSLFGKPSMTYQRGLSGGTVAQHYGSILEKRPDDVSASPTLIRLLCEESLKRQDGLRVKTVNTLGEAVTPDLRQLVKKAWGARVIDRYSCGELGILALQCPLHDHYHVLSSHVLLEIVDEQGCAVGVGEPGRVLVTGLHGYAMPLLRYDLGDVACWGEACDCGIRLPVLKEILGKTRNYVTLPNGNKHFVTLGGSFGHDVQGLLQRQVYFHETGKIELQYRSMALLSSEDIAKLVKALQDRFGYAWPVDLKRVDYFPEESLWKRQEFIKVP